VEQDTGSSSYPSCFACREQTVWPLSMKIHQLLMLPLHRVSRPNLAGGFWLRVVDIGAPHSQPSQFTFLNQHSRCFFCALHGHAKERSLPINGYWSLLRQPWRLKMSSQHLDNAPVNLITAGDVEAVRQFPILTAAVTATDHKM
jgi:hypothetical protein